MEQFRTFGVKFARKIDLRRLGALAVLTLGSFSIWIALTSSVNRQIAPDYTSLFRSAGQDTPQISLDANDSDRAVYPYSVIPGGVESAAELRNSVARDPVVAKHYEDFYLERARVVRLSEDRALYVSYRLGNNVFWSKKRLMLRKGETVITDGGHMARTRCGNRLAEAPTVPVMAAEPELEAAPPEEAQALVGGPAFAGAPVASGEVPLTPTPTSAISPGSGFPGGGIIGSPGIPIAGGGTPSSPSTPVTPIIPPPPITTPEPETLLMLSAGLTGILLGRKKWKS
jgi:hypothetical protein